MSINAKEAHVHDSADSIDQKVNSLNLETLGSLGWAAVIGLEMGIGTVGFGTSLSGLMPSDTVAYISAFSTLALFGDGIARLISKADRDYQKPELRNKRPPGMIELLAYVGRSIGRRVIKYFHGDSMLQYLTEQGIEAERRVKRLERRADRLRNLYLNAAADSMYNAALKDAGALNHQDTMNNTKVTLLKKLGKLDEAAEVYAKQHDFANAYNVISREATIFEDNKNYAKAKELYAMAARLCEGWIEKGLQARRITDVQQLVSMWIEAQNKTAVHESVPFRRSYVILRQYIDYCNQHAVQAELSNHDKAILAYHLFQAVKTERFEEAARLSTVLGIQQRVRVNAS